MDIEDAKSKARKTFESWYPLFRPNEPEEIKDTHFEMFFSGYLAGTRYKPGHTEDPKSFQRIIQGDINRDLNL